MLVSASPTSLPLLFSCLTLVLSSPPCPLFCLFFYLKLSRRNCFLFPVLSGYNGSPDTRFSRGTTRLMSWPDGERYLLSLQSLVVSRIHSFLFSDWRRTVSSKIFDTQIPLISTKKLVLPSSRSLCSLCLHCNGHSLLLSSYLFRIGTIENSSCSACEHPSQDISFCTVQLRTLGTPLALWQRSVSLEPLVQALGSCPASGALWSSAIPSSLKKGWVATTTGQKCYCDVNSDKNGARTYHLPLQRSGVVLNLRRVGPELRVFNRGSQIPRALTTPNVYSQRCLLHNHRRVTRFLSKIDRLSSSFALLSSFQRQHSYQPWSYLFLVQCVRATMPGKAGQYSAVPATVWYTFQPFIYKLSYLLCIGFWLGSAVNQRSVLSGVLQLIHCHCRLNIPFFNAAIFPRLYLVISYPPIALSVTSPSESSSLSFTLVLFLLLSLFLLSLSDPPLKCI